MGAISAILGGVAGAFCFAVALIIFEASFSAAFSLYIGVAVVVSLGGLSMGNRAETGQNLATGLQIS